MATRFHRRARAHPPFIGMHTHHEEDPPIRYVWATARIALGLVFLWAFLDKVFGFGLSTPPERAWLAGGSPTRGFLSAVEGPFAGAFHAMAGNPVVDWLFMVGLLGIGLALLLGIGMRVAAVGGALLLLLMWLASLPLENHPFVDDHLVYATLLVGLALERAGETWGLGRWWQDLPLVRRARWLV